MDRALLEALLRLRNADLTPYMSHLKERLEHARDNCTGLSGEALFRAQGRAGELRELIQLVEDAPKLIDKMRN